MATRSVRTIALTCLDRSPPISVRRHVLGVYDDNDNQVRSLRRQLDLIEQTPFIRLVIVTVRPVGSTLGQYANLQRDLDAANEIWQRACNTWIYCVDSLVERTAILGNDGVLNQNACPLGIQGNPTAEENALFNLGRGRGEDLVGYYIGGSTNPALGGCSAYPQGRRGFWVAFGSSVWMFAHELTHVIGLNPHPANDPNVPDNDQDNLMWPTPGAITNPPPDLRAVQCNRVRNDPGMETCQP
jgi:hypothetical protein